MQSLLTSGLWNKAEIGLGKGLNRRRRWQFLNAYTGPKTLWTVFSNTHKISLRPALWGVGWPGHGQTRIKRSGFDYWLCHLNSCVTLGKLLNFSEPQNFSLLYPCYKWYLDGHSTKVHLLGLLWPERLCQNPHNGTLFWELHKAELKCVSSSCVCWVTLIPSRSPDLQGGWKHWCFCGHNIQVKL